MTHKEQLAAALERKVPDQVPVTWEMETRYATTIAGGSGWRSICDAHRLLGSSIFNLQGVGPVIHYKLRSGYSESRDIELQADGSTLQRWSIITPSGSLSRADLHGYMPHDPVVAKHIEYLIKTHSDYEIYADYIQEVVRTAEPDVSEALAAYDYVGDDGMVGFWMPDAVYHLAHLRRDQDFIMDLLEEPQLIEEVLRRVDRYEEVQLQAFNASAAEGLVYDICWASLSLLNPKLVRQFVIPRARWAVENVVAGKYIVFFQTGRIREVVPDLVECRPHGMQHFDVLGDCDLAEIKRSFGQETCIIGNLNPVILAHGSVAEARQEARRCLDAAMAGGGYIMSTSDELPADARIENLRAIVETVALEGQY